MFDREQEITGMYMGKHFSELLVIAKYHVKIRYLVCYKLRFNIQKGGFLPLFFFSTF